MSFPVTPARFVVACGILIFSLVFPPAMAAAERPSNAGQLLFWLLGVHSVREEGTVSKLDVNSATPKQLEAVPGIERRHALRIVAQRPYARLSDLGRAGLSPRLVEWLAAFLTVDPESPSALYGRPTAPPPP